MNIIRFPALLIIPAVLALLAACGDVDLIEGHDPTTQWQEDLELIREYIGENEWSDSFDTTANGTRYVVLDTGKGSEIHYDDIVRYHYIAKLSDNTVFSTSIDTVAKNHDIFNEDKIYEPKAFTHTSTGWAVRDVYPSVNRYANHEAGFKQGITAVCDSVNVGGHATIISPSINAYGPSSNLGVPANEVIIYEVFITHAD